MEVSEFAERILFGKSIGEKLLEPSSLSDVRRPGAIRVPDAPGRPVELAFNSPRSRVPFPGIHELDRAEVRGRVLHFFANHELLALELMALTLLRFPDAPDSFRMGIVETMLEEQKHMRLYAERMAIAGVEFGEIPVNEYFWTCLSDIRSPMEFVTGMSMTLEQANIDYSAYYRKAFRAIGDVETADVLDIVYREEIGHVKHGVVWFNRWCPDGDERFAAWLENLPEKLPAVRARGIGFDEEGRRAAGLSDAFIRQLKVLGGSSGRPPNIYVFDPGVEAGLREDRASERRVEREIRRDLQILPLFLAHSDDVLLVDERPDEAFLIKLRQLGYTIPEVCADDTLEDATAHVRYAKLGELRPWGWSPRTRRIAVSMTAPRVKRDLAPNCDVAALSMKDRWSALRDELVDELQDPRIPRIPSATVASGEELRIFTGTTLPALLKPTLGTSGRGTRRLFTRDDVGKAAADLRGTHLVEPLLERVMDFSWQATVTRDGELRHDGFVRVLNDRLGQFRGAVPHRMTLGLPTDVVRFVHDDGKDSAWLERAMRRVATRVGESLSAGGYHGVFGLDGYMYREDGALRINPLSEVNVRYTMGRTALALREPAASASTPVWLHLQKAELARQPGALDRIIDLLSDELQPSWLRGGRPRDRVVRGAWWTTQPERASHLLTLMVLGANDADALDIVDKLHPGSAAILRGEGLSWRRRS